MTSKIKSWLQALWTRWGERSLPLLILAGMVFALTVLWDFVSFLIFVSQSPLQPADAGSALEFLRISLTGFIDAGQPITGVFFGAENLGNILRQNAHYGILAVGMTFVIISGGIDLSVGSLLAATSVVATSLIVQHPDRKDPAFALMVIAAGVIVGAALGLINGLTITYSKSAPGYFYKLLKTRRDQQAAPPRLLMAPIQPFIVTLAMMSVARGLAFLWTGGSGVDIYGVQPPLFARLGEDLSLPSPGKLGALASLGLAAALLVLIRRRTASKSAPAAGLRSAAFPALVALAIAGWAAAVYFSGVRWVKVPTPGIIFLATVAAAHVVLSRTRFGRFTYALGSNEDAAILSGVPVPRVKILVYGICGGLCGLAGMIYSSVQNSGRPDDGVGFELDAIAAVVIGGANLMGGRGGVGGTLIGALIVGVLNVVLSLRNIDPNLQRVLKGLIIIAAVLLQRDREK